MYEIDITPSCQKSIDKLCKKNPVLAKALENKIEEIRHNPQHYKPLSYDFKGEFRVHILKSFVLTFMIENYTVVFVHLKHHDEAYRR